ncbi:toprim domain-containing protein [Endozoicomonas sp. Mp262]|uniref:toprim domain-containing protein n=1 Tax=Endozoicomonas sp. Mp262 TaxID=2919499 RepID=UPI0021DFA5F3
MKEYSQECMNYMRDVGLAYGEKKPVEPVFDGSLHRHHIEGDKRGSKNGFYIGFIHSLDATSGKMYACMSFGSWRTGRKYIWRSNDTSKLTTKQREAIQRQQEAAQKKYKAELMEVQRQAANESLKVWKAGDVVDVAHLYLLCKSVRAYGIRQLRNTLLIPIRDINGKLTSIQFINAEGEKFFQTGGRTKGCFHRIGSPVDSTIYIAEGYATGATIHEVTGHAVAMALYASNLVDVAKNLRNKYPDYNLIIAADDDRFTVGNPGVTYARRAADIVGAEVLIPEFPKDASGTDFNDLMQLEVSHG